jgi:DNA-binding NarL/FixJ family response regulator
MKIKLSKREYDVLVRLGFADADIANQLNIRICTVKTYVRALKMKFGADTRGKVILYAIRKDIVNPYNFIL